MGFRNALSSVPVLVWCLVVLSPFAIGQVEPNALLSASPGGTTNFRFAEPNELTIVVALLGEVQKPGRYEISRTINLLDLIALAGGFTPASDPRDVKITRTTGSGGRTERREFSVDLDAPTRLTEEAISLQQGDFIYIGRASSITADRIIQYVTAAVVLLTAYVTISQK